jgi:NitT/TauT family transport system substrate-binding protein
MQTHGSFYGSGNGEIRRLAALASAPCNLGRNLSFSAPFAPETRRNGRYGMEEGCWRVARSGRFAQSPFCASLADPDFLNTGGEALMPSIQSRRDFLASLTAAGAAGVLSPRISLADEGPPETTTIRLLGDASICQAPGFIADDLLRAEGFTDIRYLYPSEPEWETKGQGRPRYLLSASVDNGVASGEIDFDMFPPASVISQLDAGASVTAVAGVHSGCYELFAHESVQTITDLRGHSVSVRRLHSASYLQLAVMAANVGLDPRKDINWVKSPNAMELFIEGKVDAFIGFPPEPQELRARKIGRVILSTTTDQPWSQYLCCIVAGNREFVRNHPVATKRFLRAILKASDLCAVDPEGAARRLVDGGWTPHYGYALQTLRELPYASWREYDPEDALRFYALRLHEVGMIQAIPNQLLTEGADWRFFNELRRELKA